MDNITIEQLTAFFSGASLTQFFIKSFSIVFSLLFIVYAVVTHKQIQEMTKTIKNPRNTIISLVSFLQIIIGLLLMVYAILFV